MSRDVDMEHLQALARLELEPGEAEVLARDVAAVLAYFDQLADVDTDGVEELVRPVVPARAWRADAVGASLERARVLELANDRLDGFIKVPRTVDED